ncbi:unnamed protein product [Polarella glacialis]|nr:unnamed protein product [Polarella glacialis]
MLGVDDHEFSQAVANQAIPQLKYFKVEELLKLTWGAAALGFDVDLSRAIQAEVAGRVAGVDLQDFPPPARKMFVEEALGVLWACNFAGLLSTELLEATRLVVRKAGMAIDIDVGRILSAFAQSTANSKTSPQLSPLALLEPGVCHPQIVVDLDDRLVIFKPAGWEVHDQHSQLQLSSFLQAVLGNGFPILHDVSFQFGFLHRLDVPSSGLILAAKTYEAYYDLQVQLNAGEISRDYVVLCHGWVPTQLQDIRARVYWRGLLPTSSGELGKPSRTQLKVLAHAARKGSALSLVAVRIATGRRHQIRSHFSHMGHPTVCDGKYATLTTLSSDKELCGRNFLHRSSDLIE